MEIQQPFQSAPDPTFFLRLSWSPEGQYIAAANAWHQNRYAVALLRRGSGTDQLPEWESEQNFIIHQAAAVAAFNPRILRRRTGRGLDLACAVGGADCNLSVWVGGRLHPVVLVTALFEKPILDVAWGADGRTLAAWPHCSLATVRRRVFCAFCGS